MDNANVIVSVLCSLISGLAVALPSVYATKHTIETNNALQDERIMQMQNEIKQLANDVKAHNNFGLQLTELRTRLDVLERAK